MKVLHVTSGYFPQHTGGTQTHIRDLCSAQKKLGLQVAILTHEATADRDNYTVRQHEWDGVEVTALQQDFSDCQEFGDLFFNDGVNRAFAEKLQAHSYDVVHFHHFSGLSISMVEVARKCGTTPVITLHDYWLQCPRGQRFFPDDNSRCEQLDRSRCVRCLRQLVPTLLPEGTGSTRLAQWEQRVLSTLEGCPVIAPSEFIHDRFVEWGLEADRCVTIPHGIPHSKLNAPPRGASPIRTIGFLGTVMPTKGIEQLLSAFNHVAKPDLELHVHGEIVSLQEGKSYREQLEQRVARGRTVRFFGRYEHDDLPRILATLDLVVVPSIWWETFGLVAREAAIAGLPVIVAKIGGLESAVDDGIALGFDPDQPSQLTELIDLLCSDPDLRQAMTGRGNRVRTMVDYAADVHRVYQQANSD